MARPRFSLVKNDSTAHLGFKQKLRLAAGRWNNNGDAVELSGARQPAKGCPQGKRGGVHPFGVPPKGNANFAWVQHFMHHLAPNGSFRIITPATRRLN
jgi:hypothetical protein